MNLKRHYAEGTKGGSKKYIFFTIFKLTYCKRLNYIEDLLKSSVI